MRRKRFASDAALTKCAAARPQRRLRRGATSGRQQTHEEAVPTLVDIRARDDSEDSVAPSYRVAAVYEYGGRLAL